MRKKGRRECLGEATVGALTVQTAGESSEGAPNESKAKIKRICIEEHWAAKRWAPIVFSSRQIVLGYPGGGNGASRKDWPKPIGKRKGPSPPCRASFEIGMNQNRILAEG